MITIRRSEDRGHVNHGWLSTYHTFSFASYRDPDHVRFRALRVMNEDFVQPGEGFGEHPHHDMEIVTYVLEGALEHKDSMGHGEVLRAGEFQRMSAGTGITHSEFNPSATEPVHLMQIWIIPDRRGVAPRYEQRRFPTLSSAGRLTLLASPDGRDGSIQINAGASVYAATLGQGQGTHYALAPGRGAWVQVVRGGVQLGEQSLSAGDGASVSEQPAVEISAQRDAELLLFDLV